MRVLREFVKFFRSAFVQGSQRRIKDPVKYLWWSFFQKMFMAKSRHLFLQKSSVIDICQDTKYAQAIAESYFSMIKCKQQWQFYARC